MTSTFYRRIAYLIIEPMLNEFGLTCKNEKLFYIHYPNASKKYIVLVSHDIQDVFKFLKIDYKKFKKGFKNIYELFDYFIFNCPYFDKFVCTSQNLDKFSAEDKTVMESFKSYLKKNTPENKFNYPTYTNLNLEIVNNFFSERNVKEIIQSKTKETPKAVEIAKKFNLHLVYAWAPELKNKRNPTLTGQVMSGFVDFINDTGVEKSFQSYLQKATAEEIKTDFIVYFESVKV